MAVVVTLSLILFTRTDSPAAILNDVRGRPTARFGELSYVKRWLDDCLNNHPKHIRTPRRCDFTHGHADNIDTMLPKRVLDLHWLDEFQSLRLVDGSEKRGRYATLTYCWGPNPTKIYKTTSSNLAQNMDRIAIHELNPLFQDVVQVCRSLEIPYLWIDALCIIQDDKDDWMNESRRMCDVYSNSFLTLSASMARSPNDRLWYADTSPSPGTNEIPNVLTIPYHQGGELHLHPRRPIKININARGTVSRRGWCLQERYLSRRILHFARYCEWECLTTTQHETRDISIPYELSQPPPLVRPHGFEMVQGGLLEETRSIAERPYNIWYALLEDYTGRNITYDGDLLPGILGLADLFARLTNDHLVCGLWSMDLVCGLMWEPRGLYKEEQHYPTCRPLMERPASWSWLSTVGPKEWFSNFSQEDTVVQGVAVDHASLTIMLRTLVVPLPFRTRLEIAQFGSTWLPWSASWLDILEDNETGREEGAPSFPRFFLLVLIKPRTIPRRREGWGMVVRRTTHRDTCVRIGSAQIAYSDDKYRAVGPTCVEFWQKQEAQTVYVV